MEGPQNLWRKVQVIHFETSFEDFWQKGEYFECSQVCNYGIMPLQLQQYVLAFLLVYGIIQQVCNIHVLTISVLVSFYVLESRLFLKKPTNWRPRVSRDLMISVTCKMSGQYSRSNERITQLPVQVLYYLILTLFRPHALSIFLTMTILIQLVWLSGLNSSGIKFDTWRSNYDSSCPSLLYLTSISGILEFLSDNTIGPIYWFFWSCGESK